MTDETHSSSEPVTVDLADGIATITVNRPDQLNAMSRDITLAFDRILDSLADFVGVRAVIITGTGRAFSAGGDLLEFKRALEVGKQTLVDILADNQRILTRVEEIPVPVIGAANGTAVAGGLELLLCCDIVIAAEGAKLGDGHARYGVVPAGGASVRLPRKIGPARAAQLFYTADLVDAATLRDWGLINEVVPLDRLMDRARELARAISRCSPEAVRHIKAMITAPYKSDEAGLRAEIDHFADHVNGSDLAEGLGAFAAKRLPQYKD